MPTSMVSSTLGGDWFGRPTPEQENAQIAADLAAQRAAERAAAVPSFDWSSLDDGQCDFSSTMSYGPPGLGCNLRGWFQFRHRAGDVAGFNFSNAQWRKGDGALLVYTDTDFRGADMQKTNFDGATFGEGCLFDEKTNFSGCNMRNVRFEGSAKNTIGKAKFVDAEFTELAFQKDEFGENIIGIAGIEQPEGVVLIEDSTSLLI